MIKFESPEVREPYAGSPRVTSYPTPAPTASVIWLRTHGRHLLLCLYGFEVYALRLKHFIAVTVFVPTALLLLATIFAVQNTTTSKLSQLNELRYAANLSILSESVRSSLLAQDLASLDEQLLSLLESPDIESALISDMSGVVVSSPDPRSLGKPANLEGDGWRSLVIEVAGRPRGNLHVQFDLTRSSTAIQDVFKIGLGLVIVTLLVLAALAYWMGHSISARIDVLNQNTKRMIQGDLSTRNELTGSDEISQLGRAFDEMASQIQDTLVDLSQSDQRTALALEAGNMGIWVYDTAEGEVYMDGRLAELYGVTQPTGQYPLENLINPVHPDDIESRASFIDQALLADRAVEITFRVVLNDGSIRWIRSQANALFTATHARIVGIDQDITDTIEQLRKIESLKDELERSNRELDDFAHIASHDLKEPLRGIANYAQFMKEDYGPDLDETANQYIDRMVALAQNLSDMIGDLLRMSRMSKIENAGKTASFADVCLEVKESLQFTLDEKNAQCTMQPDLGEVHMDSANLRELLRNMVVNSLKYNRSETPTVELFFDNERQAFAIRDNGIGIRQDQISEIFTPFRHLNAHDAFGRSTGLGMTIVKKIIDAAGGTIEVESEVDVGTTIYFSLPRVQ